MAKEIDIVRPTDTLDCDAASVMARRKITRTCLRPWV